MINPGYVGKVNGQDRMVGFKEAQFHPMGSSSINPDPNSSEKQLPPYGMLNTNDPETIDALEDRRQSQMAVGDEPDVLTVDEYNRKIIPLDKQVAAKTTRIMELESQLSDILAAQGKIQRGPGRPRKTEDAE